jgi:hypothetical protein
MGTKQLLIDRNCVYLKLCVFVRLCSETASVIHARGVESASAFLKELRRAAQPRHMARSWSSLAFKNAIGNSTKFFCMFLAESYLTVLEP